MGSPNFASSNYPTLGLTVNIPSDADIAEYRSYLEDFEGELSDDEIFERLLQSDYDYISEFAPGAKSLCELLNKTLDDWRINPLVDEFEADCREPFFTFDFEYGYHDGFRIEITAALDTDEKIRLFYDKNRPYYPGMQEMGWRGFKSYIRHMEKWCIYVMRELATLTPLYGVGGGWCGCNYTLEKNRKADHDKFSYSFRSLMLDIERARGFCCDLDFFMQFSQLSETA